MSLHFPLPSFLCGGEGSPPFGAPAVRETPCTRSLGNGTAPGFSWQCPSLPQQAGKATLTCFMEHSDPVAAAAPAESWLHASQASFSLVAEDIDVGEKVSYQPP